MSGPLEDRSEDEALLIVGTPLTRVLTRARADASEERAAVQELLRTMRPADQTLLTHRLGLGEAPAQSRPETALALGLDLAEEIVREERALLRLAHPARSSRLRRYILAQGAAAPNGTCQSESPDDADLGQEQGLRLG